MSDKPVHRITETRGEFQEAVRDALDRAAEQGCRELTLVDPDFADWPLGEQRVLDALTRWAQSQRKLTLVARSYDMIVRRHPRFVDWRRNFAHVITCREPDEADADDTPSILLASGLLVLRRIDARAWRASLSTDQADTIVWRDGIDALLQRSSDAFPATSLGL
jgi:hypothetical protein